MNHSPQRIVVVIHSLSGGGSEHAAAMMANFWADQGRDVALITLDDVENDAIAVGSKVQRIGLGMLKPSNGVLTAIAANYKRVRRLRRVIQDAAPNIVVSLTDRMNVVTILACTKIGVPVVACERTDPRHHKIGRLWERLRRWSYPKANAIVVQTDAVREVVERMSASTPVCVIPNAIRSQTDEQAGDVIELDSQKKWFIGIGRLSFEKGFDRMISAFSSVSKSHSDWNLAIVGDGAERARLEGQANELGIVDRIMFAGWRTNITPLLIQADIFVLSSRYEGFPNALLEAMAQGVTPICVECESGPREIITSEANGLLSRTGADDLVVQELAINMDRLITDKTLRDRLGEEARKVTSEYGQETHFEKWDQLFHDVMAAE
jgi:GalNAc-alpha-(1->4)-GalNAc-alpha-(1->3)-diNAcBac-PP-undecaprenol alpha-1,4-N-acetyl-D-galactosaminyltransferase